MSRNEETWNELIARKRDEQGLTLKELGALSGVHYSRISRIERGNDAHDETWAALAKALGLVFTPAKLSES